MEKFNAIPHMRIGNSEYCTYCGEIPSHLDHIIPFSFFKPTNIDRNGRNRSNNSEGILTPSCGNCNMILGNKMFRTFDARLFYIKSKLFTINKKILKTGNWKKDELEEVEGYLKTFIKGRHYTKRGIINRLKWQDSLEFLEIRNKIKERIINKEDKIKPFFYSYFMNGIEMTEEEKILNENIQLLIETGTYQIN